MDSETHRQCSKCNETKLINEYHWRKDHQCYRYDCKTCVNAKRSERGKKEYQQNKTFHNERNARWEQANKARRKAQKHEFYLQNKEAVLARNKAWIRKQMKEDVAFKLAARARSRINQVLNRGGVRKAYRTLKLLGCTKDELKTHIESQFKEGMTWDKLGVGAGTFQIDHIIPLGMFNLIDPEEQRRAFHYTNLQPLWYEDHVAKTARELLYIRRATAQRKQKA